MTNAEVIFEMNEYMDILKEEGREVLSAEKQLLDNEVTAPQILALSSVIRARLRDNAVLVRMMQIVKFEFIAGNPNWITRHRKLWKMRKANEKNNGSLNSIIASLNSLIRNVI